MSQILIHQANCISTQDPQERELRGGSILIQDGLIKEVFDAAQFKATGEHLLSQVDEVIDARQHLVIPGMVNCHHHMVQSLTRAYLPVQNAGPSGLQGGHGRVADEWMHHQQ